MPATHTGRLHVNVSGVAAQKLSATPPQTASPDHSQNTQARPRDKSDNMEATDAAVVRRPKDLASITPPNGSPSTPPMSQSQPHPAWLALAAPASTKFAWRLAACQNTLAQAPGELARGGLLQTLQRKGLCVCTRDPESCV